MALVGEIGLWIAVVAFCAGGVMVGIQAGRRKHLVAAVGLPGIEMVLSGAVLVSWMFVVWFVAKALMGIGLTASVALLAGIGPGVAAAALAVLSSLRILRIGYRAFGLEQRFSSDIGDSLWLSRTGLWRWRDRTGETG